MQNNCKGKIDAKTPHRKKLRLKGKREIILMLLMLVIFCMEYFLTGFYFDWIIFAKYSTKELCVFGWLYAGCCLYIRSYLWTALKF